jgi:hypothetical protein
LQALHGEFARGFAASAPDAFARFHRYRETALACENVPTEA